MALAPTTSMKPTAHADTVSRAEGVARRTTETAPVRWILIAIAILFLVLFIVLPAANVFAQAFSKGWSGYIHTLFPAPVSLPQGGSGGTLERIKLTREHSRAVSSAAKNWASIRMTLGIAAVVVPANVLFGVAAAWAIAKFKFRGRTLLISLIDLPFSVSPVVAGLVFVLLFGRTGLLPATHWQWYDPTSLYWRGFGVGSGFWCGWWPLAFHETYTGIIFTPLAIALASIFVTFPFVARTLIPLMETQGTDEELAAISLGATGRQAFFRVTMPNIKWGLLYGVILCTARALGEFGAVSVVSGHTDANDTMPLRIEKLWNEYNSQAAFTVASLLTLLAVATLVAKTWVEYRTRKED